MYISTYIESLSYGAAGRVQALTEATKDQLSPAVTPFGVILVVLIFAGVVMRKVVKE